MALMFRSVLQNAGGAAELIVTCDSEFAGATISCSDGTTTLNKTCPSSSPYEVTFKIPNSGDWTISATVSGTAYTSDPISVELDYTALLEYGFNWRRWVDTAQFLDSTNYNSLDDVLADEAAVRELCLEHACVDYLARVASATADVETIIENDLFAKWVNNSDYSLDILGANTAIKALMDEADKYFYGEWIITDDTTTPPTWGPKGNVPVMTSNSAPYGEASASVTPYSAHPAWHAFDGNSSTAYSAGNTANAILSYKFTNPVCVKRVLFDTDKSANYSASIKTWDIIAKNDASANWETIYSGSNDDVKIVEQEISCNQYYLYWGIKIKTSYRSESYALDTLQFYGRELSVSVPKMDTNTTPYGEVIADSNNTNAYKAFDGSDSTYWNVLESVRTGCIQYKFPNPVVIKEVVFKPYAYSSERNTWYQYKIQASNTGNTNDWVDMTDTLTNLSATAIVDITNNTPYRYWRNICSNTIGDTGNTTPTLYTLQFYGLDYSEKEFEEGTTKKWLYDHGVELETLTVYENGSTTVAERQPDCILLSSTSDNNTAAGVYAPSMDLTPYSLMRCKVGKEAILFNSRIAQLLVTSIVNANSNSSATADALVNANYLPNNPGLDISSVNQSLYPYILQANGGSAIKGTFVEWWLE